MKPYKYKSYFEIKLNITHMQVVPPLRKRHFKQWTNIYIFLHHTHAFTSDRRPLALSISCRVQYLAFDSLPLSEQSTTYLAEHYSTLQQWRNCRQFWLFIFHPTCLMYHQTFSFMVLFIYVKIRKTNLRRSCDTGGKLPPVHQ